MLWLSDLFILINSIYLFLDNSFMFLCFMMQLDEDRINSGRLDRLRTQDKALSTLGMHEDIFRAK